MSKRKKGPGSDGPGKQEGDTMPETGFDLGNLSGIGGLMKGLGSFIEGLKDLAEKGAELKRSGELGSKDGVSGVYGFNIRVGGLGAREGGSPTVGVSPFGNVGRKTGVFDVKEGVREPIVDVFDEKAFVRVVAEVPGVAQEDISVSLEGDVLLLKAHGKEKRYEKEVLLESAPAGGEPPGWSLTNGVLDVRVRKAKQGRST